MESTMARTINQEENTAKRSEILNVAQRLVFTKGYERMTIQDILAELKMSSGAFYHYFPTKPAVLEALIERIQQEGEQPLRAVVHDPDLPALEKLQRFFAVIDRLRITHKATVVEMLRVWYTDENAIIRQKVDADTVERRAPLLVEIVHQGIQEDVFSTPFPDQSGEVILSLLQGMGNAHAKLLLTFVQDRDEQRCIEGVVSIHTAYMDAIERVLGAPSNVLYRIDAAAMKVWIAAL
jgi:AcrR family transcriptional regulator